MRLFGLTVSTIVLLIANAGRADLANASVPGFQCVGINIKKLHLTSDDLRSGKGFPWILESPNEGAKQIGQVSSIIYVAVPMAIDNGFIKTMTYNGKIGWVDQNSVRPLRRADGSTGGRTLYRRSDGRVMFHLDAGIGINY